MAEENSAEKTSSTERKRKIVDHTINLIQEAIYGWREGWVLIYDDIDHKIICIKYNNDYELYIYKHKDRIIDGVRSLGIELVKVPKYSVSLNERRLVGRLIIDGKTDAWRAIDCLYSNALRLLEKKEA